MTDTGQSPPDFDRDAIRRVYEAMRAQEQESSDILKLRAKTMKALSESLMASLTLMDDASSGEKTCAGFNPLLWCFRNPGKPARVQITIPCTTALGAFRSLTGSLVMKSSAAATVRAAQAGSDTYETDRAAASEIPFTLSGDSGDRDSFDFDEDEMLDDLEFEESEFELTLDPAMAVHEEVYRLASADILPIPQPWTEPTASTLSGRWDNPRRQPKVRPLDEAIHRPGEIRTTPSVLGAASLKGESRREKESLIHLEGSDGLFADLNDRKLSVAAPSTAFTDDKLLVAELTAEIDGESTRRHSIVDFPKSECDRPDSDGKIHRDVKIPMPHPDDTTSLSLTVRPFEVRDIWMMGHDLRTRFFSCEPLSSLTVRRTSNTNWNLTLFQQDLEELNSKKVNSTLVFRLLRYDGGAQ